VALAPGRWEVILIVSLPPGDGVGSDTEAEQGGVVVIVDGTDMLMVEVGAKEEVGLGGGVVVTNGGTVWTGRVGRLNDDSEVVDSGGGPGAMAGPADGCPAPLATWLPCRSLTMTAPTIPVTRRTTITTASRPRAARSSEGGVEAMTARQGCQ
jgi:hypothetical protein